MEAKESKIQDILTENKKFIIPPYQRPYSWGKDNAEQLIDDIYQSCCSEDREYFIGSMICINQSNNTFEVVDGQQRLTTLSLIFSQLKALIDHRGIKDDLQKRILPIDVFSDQTDEPRLRVRTKEYQLYKNYILQGKMEYKPEQPSDTETLFIENHRIIGEYLLPLPQDDLKKLAKFILQNVFIVFVQTDNIASSFRLFNVLNSRGLALSSADLLKNMLFEASHNTPMQQTFPQVEQDWSKIEDLIGINQLDKFLTVHKISEKKDRDRVVIKGLEYFNAQLKSEFSNNVNQLSHALLQSAQNYADLMDVNILDPKTRRCINTLNSLAHDAWVPPLLAFLNRMKRQRDLNWEQFTEFVKIFEKVFMQGWLKKMVLSQREMVCYSTLVAINNAKPFDKIIEHILLHADNEGFAAALDKDIYEPHPNQVHLIKTVLLRIDTERHDDSVSKKYHGRITIEHILPQKMNHPYWQERFSPELHHTWLHKLGNLTLISGSKNSEAQNSDFEKKKTVYAKPNNRSSFDITKEVCEIPDWNVETLKARHQQLTAVVKMLWSV